jgi:hypothetical protein
MKLQSFKSSMVSKKEPCPHHDTLISFCWREACHRILDYIVLRYWYIYIGVSQHNPREGGCTRVGGLTADQTARGSGARETLKP